MKAFIAIASLIIPTLLAAQDETSRFTWHAGETPAGQTVITRAGDGRVSNESFMHWNNREYRINSEIQLNAEGMITSQRISGVSAFGAPIDEQFSYRDGLAQWRSTGDAGSLQSESAAFYLPTEWGALAATEALVRAAVKQLDAEIALFPSGTARVEKLVSEMVHAAGESVVLTLYAIHGLDFTPVYAWFGHDMRLLAIDRGRMGMLPESWDQVILQNLGRVQAEQNARLFENLSARLSHRPERPVLFTNVNLLDVAGDSFRPNYQVLVSEGRIAAVSNLPLEIDGALVIDGSNKTLMPGLWDMHGHFELTDGILNIAGGITTVRDLGSTHERIMELVEKFDSGKVIGPTTHRAAMIDRVSPYANRNPAKDLDEALAMVDRFAGQGYIQIKLYSSIDPEWVPVIAERAHGHGMRVSGHVPAFMSAEQAINAGYDEIQHMNMVFLNFIAGDREDTRKQLRFTMFYEFGGQLDLNGPEVTAFIDLLKKKDVVIDPTISIIQKSLTHKAGQPDPAFAAISDHLPPSVRRPLYKPWFVTPEDQVQNWAATEQRSLEMIKKLHDSGVRLVAGSDNMPGFTIHRELELYQGTGISNAAVLRLATLGSAEVLGLDQETGSIDIGKVADLLLLDGNPLEDISALRRAVLVMKGGVMFDPAALYRAVGVRPVAEDVALWAGVVVGGRSAGDGSVGSDGVDND